MHTRLLSLSRLLAVVSVAAIAALGLAACGGDDDETGTTAAGTTATDTTEATTGGGGAETLDFEADPNGELAYTEAPTSAKAGEATVNLDNPSSTPHDVVLEEGGSEIARTDVITDSTATTTATLEPGTVTYYCSVSGHREAGMEGTFDVK